MRYHHTRSNNCDSISTKGSSSQITSLTEQKKCPAHFSWQISTRLVKKSSNTRLMSRKPALKRCWQTHHSRNPFLPKHCDKIIYYSRRKKWNCLEQGTPTSLAFHVDSASSTWYKLWLLYTVKYFSVMGIHTWKLYG